MEKEILEERERIKEEAVKTIAYILRDSKQGKVKNKSYPIKKIENMMYALYGIKGNELREEAESLSIS